MTPTTHLYDALHDYLRQCEIVWRDVRHLQTLCWMMIGMIQSEKVHPSGFGVYVTSRARKAQSHQRRFRRWLGNRRIDVAIAHQALIGQALSEWGRSRLYLSLDTTMLWNCFCVIWVGVVYRGRTIPICFRVVRHKSSTVRLWYIQRVLRAVARVLPANTSVVLLGDRGFADGKLLKYLRQTLKWHFRIRIKRRFQYQVPGEQRWRKVAKIRLQPGEAYFTGPVHLGQKNTSGPVYLAFALDQESGEDWMIVSDEPTTLQTFAQYRLRFQVEESFLDLKSNGFQLEACRLRDKFALSQLLWVVALTMLFLVLQATQVVAQGQRQLVDPHWKRGMSYLKIGWNWIRRAITQQTKIPILRFLSSASDPEPAMASKRQYNQSLNREFTVLKHIPA
ncbi:transposase [filamentous cyanobacterium LEGE 11480]|uniref:Transposase n=1 Tax=Romeriopsis navalis LEGE 11480 TaxID=2777977 RepID=A0A928VRU9_9CYAN|nr:transposase [Romeriopsis navalis]MBE9031420.1 transposase [Romeriopsis navalis LEGE 11480]